MASLISTKLPSELLLCISDYLDIGDIRALAATCKSVYPILIKQLYLLDIRSGQCKALWWACGMNERSTIQRSLDLGASVNQFGLPHGYNSHRGWTGKTPLIIAAGRQSVEAVQCLLENGAKSNLGSMWWDVTPLLRVLGSVVRHGAGNQFLATLEALLRSGANPNVRCDRNRDFPLFLSLWGPIKLPVEATRLLLEHGAVALRQQLRPSDEMWLNVLFSFLHRATDSSLDSVLVEKLDLILQYHKGTLSPIAWRRPLYTILSNPNPDTKQLLQIALRHGCDPNAMCRADGWAAKEEDSPLKVLFNSMVLAKTENAIDSDHSAGLDMLKMLLEAGADPNSRDQTDAEDVTPLTYLARMGPSPVPAASKSFLARWAITRKTVSLLSRWRAKPGGDDFYDSVMLLLLQHGASPNARCAKTGMTALHFVCGEKKVDEQHVKWLLQYGADVGAQDLEGRTAVDILSQKNSKVVKLLVK